MESSALYLNGNMQRLYLVPTDCRDEEFFYGNLSTWSSSTYKSIFAAEQAFPSKS